MTDTQMKNPRSEVSQRSVNSKARVDTNGKVGKFIPSAV